MQTHALRALRQACPKHPRAPHHGAEGPRRSNDRFWARDGFAQTHRRRTAGQIMRARSSGRALTSRRRTSITRSCARDCSGNPRRSAKRSEQIGTESPVPARAGARAGRRPETTASIPTPSIAPPSHLRRPACGGTPKEHTASWSNRTRRQAPKSTTQSVTIPVSLQNTLSPPKARPTIP